MEPEVRREKFLADLQKQIEGMEKGLDAVRTLMKTIKALGKEEADVVNKAVIVIMTFQEVQMEVAVEFYKSIYVRIKEGNLDIDTFKFPRVMHSC